MFKQTPKPFSSEIGLHTPIKMKTNTVLSFLLFFLISPWGNQLLAVNYHFSTLYGDDSRSFQEAQNPNTPWKTLAKLNEVFNELEAGDNVFFRRDEVYFGSLGLDRLENAQILLGGYGPGEKPIISGFAQVEEWTNAGNGIYESNALEAGSGVNMVIIDGTNYPKGRYPNLDEENGGYLRIETYNEKAIINQQLSDGFDWFDAQLVLRSRHWTLERVRITNHAGVSINYDEDTEYEPNEGFGFFIQDHINTLDQFGEWYFDPVSQKIAVYFGDEIAPESVAVKVAVEDVLVEVKSSNLTFEGLIFEGANKYAFTNYSHTLEDLSILDCDIRYSGVDAVLLDNVANFTFENNTILYSNNCGLNLLYCPNAMVRNNDIEFTGMQAGMGEDGDGTYSAILSSVEGLIAENNRILNTGYIGIRFGHGDNLIKNNYINTFCAVLDDGAGIYAYDSGGDITKRKVVGNIVLNGIGANGGTRATVGTAAVGIYLDDNSQNIQVVENTVANCSGYGIFIHNVHDFNLWKNTMYNNNVQLSFRSDDFGDPIEGAVVTDNICFSKEWGQTVFEVSSNADDISNMGTLYNNYYLRPMHDQLPLSVQYRNTDDIVIRQAMDLNEWQASFGHDRNSKKSPLEFPTFAVDNILSDNKLDHYSFDDGIDGFWCFAPYSDCELDWVSSNLLDDGAVRLASAAPSRIGLPCGFVESNKQYILRFSAAASELSSVEVYFMQSEHPWETLSTKIAVQLSTERQEYELLFSYPIDEEFGSVQFDFGKENTVYWLDNMELLEAEVSVNQPDDYFRFEHNASMENLSLELDGVYLDAKHNVYSGSITLGPFESIVLIRGEEGLLDTSLDPEEEFPSLSIYPNPMIDSEHELNIRYFAYQKKSQLSIIDQLGRTVRIIEQESEIGWNDFRWNIGSLPQGSYYIYDASAPVHARKAHPFVVLR